jgi:uncharacterized protein YfiM (DUF2279 family)
MGRSVPVRARVAAAAALLVLAPVCRANESFGSEFSHFVAGAAIASAATAVADHVGAEDRAWIGFGTAVGISFVLEAAQIASNGSSQVGPSALDFASNLVGAALGAWVTDQFLLKPVVQRDSAGHQRIGLVLWKTF